MDVLLDSLNLEEMRGRSDSGLVSGKDSGGQSGLSAMILSMHLADQGGV